MAEIGRDLTDQRKAEGEGLALDVVGGTKQCCQGLFRQPFVPDSLPGAHQVPGFIVHPRAEILREPLQGRFGRFHRVELLRFAGRQFPDLSAQIGRRGQDLIFLILRGVSHSSFVLISGFSTTCQGSIVTHA
ncbi:hypothetical protein QW131_12060 [Roseibium salinum]|nr:hypothetical protein [Roseibium salinum]